MNKGLDVEYTIWDKTQEKEINKKGKIFFKEPLFGAQNNAIRKAIGVGGRPDEVLGREMITLACIDSIPEDFPVSLEKSREGNIICNEKNVEILRRIPASIGNKMIEVAVNLTTFEEEIKKNLNSLYGTTNTPKTQS